MDFLTGLTSLPNLHPALVHFPVALLPVAVLFEMALLLVRGQREWLDRAAAALYAAAVSAAAALGALAALRTGEAASDGLSSLPVDVQLRVNAHSDAAHQVLWLVALLAAVRLATAYWDRGVRRVALRAALLLIGCFGVVLLFRTADRGGGLVYRDGLAVAAAVRVAPVAHEEEAAFVQPRFDLAPGGDNPRLRWAHMQAEDALRFHSVLQPVAGATHYPVSPTERGGPGLELVVDGHTLLAMPDGWRDVQVEAEIELVDFRGVLGLAHHARALHASGLLTIAVPSGETKLISLDGDSSRVLDRSVANLEGERLRLAVSAIGRHRRGLLNGELVVHGHEPALPKGACGLYFDGKGSLRIHLIEITPVVE